MDRKIANFILSLYRRSSELNDTEFQEWAFCQAKTLIPFNAAQWAEGRLDESLGPRVHKVVLHNQPAEKTLDYHKFHESRFGRDLFAFEIVRNPGKSIRWEEASDNNLSFWDTDFYKLYCSKYREEHIIATAIQPKQGELFSVISFYRSDRSQAFTDDEKKIKETIVPHMVEAYRLCLQMSILEHVAAGQQKALALVDGFGSIHMKSENFDDTFSVANGSPVVKQRIDDPAILDLIHHEYDGYHNGVRIDCKMLPNGLYLIALHTDRLLSTLTPREGDVLILSRQGKTYQEIAETLNISRHTVSQHLRNIREKLGVKRISEIAK